MINQFLSCDWGTSSFRLRLIDRSNKASVALITTTDGIAKMNSEFQNQPLRDKSEFYQQYLHAQIKSLGAEHLTIPLIVSGMISSSIGMMELPYKELPFSIGEDIFITHKIERNLPLNRDMFIVSGIRTANDVMRGEETILLGCPVSNDKTIFLFPGTHSKHVYLENGRLVDFKTYMTGDFFEALSRNTILSASLKKSGTISTEFFKKGVRDSQEGNLLNLAFHVRTNQLFNYMTSTENYSYFSGLVIGTELKDIPRSNTNIHVVSGHTLSPLYQQAIHFVLNIDPIMIDADEALVNGHCRLIDKLLKS